MSRRTCVVTGSRAEYGLLRALIGGIRDAAGLELQLIATGTHLSPEFGLTAREIEEDGFVIDRRVENLVSSDTPAGVAKSMGLGLIGFGDALADLAPDALVVLGDRFEIFAAAAAALVARIPVAHLHGGEVTEGAVDESLRHAITKMAHLHFVAAEPYRRRVIQLGEHPDRVYTVGGLGVDAIARLSLLDRASLEAALDFRFGRTTLLVTFHPVTAEADDAAQMAELLAALETVPDAHLIFTMPNADAGGRALRQQVEAFTAARPNARAYASLGQLRYLSCLAQVDAVVGNSSSGLAEAPTFHTPTVNIGDRQRGRLKAASVIDCAPRREAIAAAIRRLDDPAFREAVRAACNPYGDGGAVGRILDVLRTADLAGVAKKSFFDLAPEEPLRDV